MKLDNSSLALMGLAALFLLGGSPKPVVLTKTASSGTAPSSTLTEAQRQMQLALQQEKEATARHRQEQETIRAGIKAGASFAEKLLPYL